MNIPLVKSENMMNLNQLTLPSLSLLASVTFYETLGLKLIVDALPRYVRFECPGGESTLSVHLVEELPTGSGITIYFECNVDEEYLRLAQAGIKFKSKPTDQRWLWREVHLSDPDGNEIILFEAGENRKNPPWRVN